MYRRKNIPPIVWALGIIVVVLLVVLLIGRFDFPGWVLRGLSRLVPSRTNLQYTPEEVQNLKADMDSLKKQNTALNEMVLEYQRVDALSQVGEDIPAKLLDARVIYRDHARLFDTAIIDHGSSDGVEVEMPVVDSHGLVGRVVATTGAISRIVLLTNPDCSFGVIDQRSRDLGIVRGTSSLGWSSNSQGSADRTPLEMLDLEYLSPSAQINVQDLLITSGLSGITPKGIRVGEVVEIISREEEGRFEIRVRPFADFAHLENVAIVLYKEQDIGRLSPPEPSRTSPMG
jgi:rod shape-determining protein MreC